MANELVEAKFREICDTLAHETGVGFEEVARVLQRLGLEGALRHRQYVQETADRYGVNNTTGYTLENISLQNIRVAAGNVAI